MPQERAGIYNWNSHQGPTSPIRTPRKRIDIDDETWRDGMQGTQVEDHPHFDQKAQYLEAAVAGGYVDHFDIGFPGSGQEVRSEIVTLIEYSHSHNLTASFSAAGRSAAIDDVRSILEIADKTGSSLEADLFLDVSKLRAGIEGWDRDEMLRKTVSNIGYAKRQGLSVMFVPERASVTPPDELFEVCMMMADAGADRIAIADTTGVLTPHGTQQILREFFEKIGKKYPDLRSDLHEHNDLNMGIANCIVAASEGIDRLHATARGIGERAGNVDLEQLVVVLDLQGLRNTDTTKIQQFTSLAADILNVPIRPHEPIVGKRSTETASGVHASTYEKIRKGEGDLPPIYFPFDPRRVGLEPRVRIGPMSGIANVYAFCNELGIDDVTEEKAREVLEAAKEKWGLLSENEVKRVIGRNGL